MNNTELFLTFSGLFCTTGPNENEKERERECVCVCTCNNFMFYIKY